MFACIRSSKSSADANANAAEAWFAENDPEGVAFEYELIGTFAA